MYIGAGTDGVHLDLTDGSRVLLLGGQPFTEEILMWWNFVARDRAELERRTRWGASTGADGRLDLGPIDARPVRSPGRARATTLIGPPPFPDGRPRFTHVLARPFEACTREGPPSSAPVASGTGNMPPWGDLRHSATVKRCSKERRPSNRRTARLTPLRTCGAAWSARRPVKAEVAGSNPVRSAARSDRSPRRSNLVTRSGSSVGRARA